MDFYAECGVRVKGTTKTLLMKVGMIAGIIVLFFASSLFPVLFILTTVAVVGAFWFWPRISNIEYEYVFCDGQLDFDRIMGNAKRKQILRVDLEDVDIVAPVRSHALDGYNHNGVKVKDFSSLQNNNKAYALVVKIKDEKYKIIFEPNVKMLECMKQKAPRKIVTY